MATYYRYASDDIVLSTDKLTTSTWTNNVNDLTEAHTSSIQANFSSPTSSGAFRIDVYNLATSSVSAEVQYALAYGHRRGSGSLDFTNDTGSFGISPSRDIYSQYRNLVYGTELTDFTFDTVTSDDIFVLNVQRSRYRQNLKPGTLNLRIKGGGGADVGANNILHLTDDSITKTGSAVITNAGRQFNIVSGSNGVMLGTTLGQTNSGSYGLFYPDAGFIIFNATAVSHSVGIAINRASNAGGKNHETFLRAISGSGPNTAGAVKPQFILDSEEKVTSNYYFTRVRNQEFNYTNNASFIETDGTLSFSSMNDNPRVYITTVGLYNDSNELVAVAKLSQPLAKDFTKEALIKVKLDY